jgi:hypothetical protein
MIGLSRARVYQLIRTGFLPTPDVDPLTRRPFFGEEAQRVCLEVRRKNRGINQKTLLFYSRRRDLGHPKSAVRSAKPKISNNQYGDLIDLLEQARVVVTVAQVEAVVKEEFPNGIEMLDPSVVFVAVHKRLRSQNPTDKQRR